MVTHAHADHTARHAAVILTEPTRRLMQARLPGQRTERVLDYGDILRSEDLREPAARGPFSVSLHPSGHILGSAMARVAYEGDSVLYTGDFKLRPGLSSERCEPVTAQTLVMETTYGRPRYRFPPTHDVLQDIRRFCTESLECRMTPVLLAYSLGKTQEVLAALAGCGLPIRLHPSAAAMTRNSRQSALLRPAAITIHDDRDMQRQRRGRREPGCSVARFRHARRLSPWSPASRRPS